MVRKKHYILTPTFNFKKRRLNKKIFVTAFTSLKRLVKVVQNHANVCDESIFGTIINEKGRCGNDIQLQFQQNSQSAVVLFTLPS